MSKATIKLSSRELLSYSPLESITKAFFRGLGPGEDASAVFARHLKEDHMLSAVSIERQPERDDDWVVFEFWESDPAITALKAESDG